ncbi:MAG: aminotransferase class IV [Bacillota bacterium]
MQNKISFNSKLAQYGIGLFETIKVVEGKAIFLEEHLTRLYQSSRNLEIVLPIKKQELKEELIEYSKKLDQQALKITICESGYNFSTREIPYKEIDYNQGYNLKISEIRRGENLLDQHKTTNYFSNIYARNKVQAQDYDEALLLDSNQFVLEATMANIFFIKDKKVYTPADKLSLLPGIIRSKVMLIAQELGIKAGEAVINKAELALFDFAFLTNSLLGLMKINQIGEIEYGQQNKIFNQLKEGLEKKEMRYNKELNNCGY